MFMRGLELRSGRKTCYCVLLVVKLGLSFCTREFITIIGTYIMVSWLVLKRLLKQAGSVYIVDKTVLRKLQRNRVSVWCGGGRRNGGWRDLEYINDLQCGS